MSFRSSSRSTRESHAGRHRFEHWYRDNQVYFITARCRDRFPAFASEQAKLIFWDRLNHYTTQARFEPWVVTLMDNHYHILGYCRVGGPLGEMMRKLHGSVAKLVNDVLQTSRVCVPKAQPRLNEAAGRLVPFWREGSNKDYFDGCLRDAKQYRLAYRYTLMQAVRARIVTDWRDYAHTRVWVELEAGLEQVLRNQAFMNGVAYKRYQRGVREEHGH